MLSSSWFPSTDGDTLRLVALSGVPAVMYPYYVSSVKRWKARCRSLDEHRLARWRWRHNFALAIYSFCVCVALVAKRPNLLDACAVSVQSPLLLSIWYASKIWEWLDTAFLILAEKPVTRLHYRHHQTTCAASSWTTGIGLAVPGPNPVVDTATFLNAFAHTLM